MQLPVRAARLFLVWGLAAAAAAQAPAPALTVEDAVVEAIRNNPTLLAERANIPIAEARVLTARLRPNPIASAAGDHLDLLGTGFNETNGGGPSEIVVSAEFLVERRGKRQGRTEVAERVRSAVEQTFLDAVRLVTLDVRNAFVDVLLARENLALANENFGTFTQITEINEARVKAGALAEVELVRSRVAALQYANAVRRAELAVRTSTTRLRTLLGRPAGSPLEVAGDLARKAAAPGLEELRGAALRSRPDLQALRREQERATAEVRLQLAQAKPDYTLGAEYRRQQVNAKSNSLTLSVSMPLPVFDRNQGEVVRAREEQRQTDLRLRAQELAVAGEVENAHSEFLTARGLVETIEGRLLGEARDVRDITEFSYRRGEASLLELLDAQRAFNETVQAHNDARAEYVRSIYLLNAACGTEVAK